MNSILLNELFDVLPENGIGHFVLEHQPFLQQIINDVHPKVIWEFGFNVGHSSALWLALTDAEIHAVDPSNSKETLKASSILKEMFPNRFTFYNCSSQQPELFVTIRDTQPDLILVDGDHSYEGCLNDLILAKDLNIKYIIIDNLEDTSCVGNATNKFLEDNKEYKLKDTVLLNTILTGLISRD